MVTTMLPPTTLRHPRLRRPPGQAGGLQALGLAVAGAGAVLLAGAAEAAGLTGYWEKTIAPYETPRGPQEASTELVYLREHDGAVSGWLGHYYFGRASLEGRELAASETLPWMNPETPRAVKEQIDARAQPITFGGRLSDDGREIRANSLTRWAEWQGADRLVDLWPIPIDVRLRRVDPTAGFVRAGQAGRGFASEIGYGEAFFVELVSDRPLSAAAYVVTLGLGGTDDGPAKEVVVRAIDGARRVFRSGPLALAKPGPGDGRIAFAESGSELSVRLALGASLRMRLGRDRLAPWIGGISPRGPIDLETVALVMTGVGVLGLAGLAGLAASTPSSPRSPADPGSGGAAPDLRVEAHRDPGAQTIEIAGSGPAAPEIRLRAVPDPGRQTITVPRHTAAA